MSVVCVSIFSPPHLFWSGHWFSFGVRVRIANGGSHRDIRTILFSRLLIFVVVVVGRKMFELINQLERNVAFSWMSDDLNCRLLVTCDREREGVCGEDFFHRPFLFCRLVGEMGGCSAISHVAKYYLYFRCSMANKSDQDLLWTATFNWALT